MKSDKFQVKLAFLNMLFVIPKYTVMTGVMNFSAHHRLHPSNKFAARINSDAIKAPVSPQPTFVMVYQTVRTILTKVCGVPMLLGPKRLLATGMNSNAMMGLASRTIAYAITNETALKAKMKDLFA